MGQPSQWGPWGSVRKDSEGGLSFSWKDTRTVKMFIYQTGTQEVHGAALPLRRGARGQCDIPVIMITEELC